MNQYRKSIAEQKSTEDLFQGIEVAKPSDLIIKQIRDLISAGVLKPGQRLPSERTLAERFQTGRGHVREALKKLEFYGILQTFPQSGTVVSSLGVKALEGLISQVLDLHGDDLAALMEARAVLEIQAARLAAERATEEDWRDLEESHREFRRKVQGEDPGLDEDLLFHVKVAGCSKNSVIRSLITLITPDILTESQKRRTCEDGSFREAVEEHEAVLEAIKARDPEGAARAMEKHMAVWQRICGEKLLRAAPPAGRHRNTVSVGD
jgi:GntR family transcriptional repressor for pyruvate dehydrogenase complex